MPCVGNSMRWSTLSNEKKYAKELLSKMTLEEKVAQLSQTVAGYRCYERDGEEFSFNQEFKNFVAEYGAMGAISNILRSCAWTQKDWGIGIEPHQRAKVANQLQKYVLENTRLGIPVLIEVEANHGVQALGSEMFPTNIGMGCMFNPELYGKVMASVGKEVRLSGNHMAFVTMFDLARDPRWGRCEEFFSEDPYLAAQYTRHGVAGIKSEKVLACCKHYCATGDCAGGLNTAEVNVGNRELHEVHLAPVAAAVESGADVIMAAYNAVDGIPCHANRYLLQDVLRNELGYDGIILSDGWGVERMIRQMGYDLVRGSAAALSAGIDLSLADNGAFLNLIEACRIGLVSEELIDAAVLRILTKKYQLGLFDNPYIDEDDALTGYLQSGEQKQLSYEAAAESAVLLKNNGILPLSSTTGVALIGAHANNLYYQLGDYTSLRKEGEGKTIREVMENTFASVTYAKGWDFKGSRDGFAEAIAAAKNSDIIVITLGGSTARALTEVEYDRNTGAAVSSSGFLDCGEGRDLASITLPGSQLELLEELKKLGKPIVALLIQGRPYEITRVCELADAVLTAWYPGQQGADAICDILTGKVNPSGRLSVSVPYSAACLPAYYNRVGDVTAKVDDDCCTNAYADYPIRTLFPFGYGLSYSSFAYSDIKANKTAENEFEISAVVENTSDIAGKEVVQLYIHGSGNSIKRRARELKGFQKILLLPHEKRRVTFRLGYEELKIYSANNRFEVEPGQVEVYIGGSSVAELQTVIETL